MNTAGNKGFIFYEIIVIMTIKNTCHLPISSPSSIQSLPPSIVISTINPNASRQLILCVHTQGSLQQMMTLHILLFDWILPSSSANVGVFTTNCHTHLSNTTSHCNHERRIPPNSQSLVFRKSEDLCEITLM